jgi:hypothetical protein
MQQNTFFVLLALAALVFLYICYCADSQESFYIPPSIVGGGDFHIQPVGAIADQGSFTNDMSDYLEGQGPI